MRHLFRPMNQFLIFLSNYLIDRVDNKAISLCYKSSMQQKSYALINIFNILIGIAVNDSYIKLII